jgi:hypothetical protein
LRNAAGWGRRVVAALIDLGKIAKSIGGVVDIFGRLAKSIEKAIKSGLRSADMVRQARERKRLRNFMLLTAHLYVVQGRLVTSISTFCEFPENARGDWEEAKFEILATKRMLSQIEEYVIPYSDALVSKHRKQYLQLLTDLDERHHLLEYVYQLDYETAVANLAKLKAIGTAYETLKNRLRDMTHDLSDIALDHGVLPLGGKEKLEALDGNLAKPNSSTAKKIKQKTSARKKRAAMRFGR